MMLSIMVVGAGAAFADQDQIDTKHQEAVDACASLNIITGFANGKFVPNDNVTREQTAKMICVLLNGGKDPVLGAGSSSFTDVANNRWSCPYIESCVSQDIIVGVGNNKFAPAGKVTGSQLAKMLLVALGFSPDHQKYAGSAWEVNVNTDASARGFYKDLEDINPSEPLTREHAAQMIWNALNAYEVEYKTNLVADKDGKLSTQITVQDKVGIDNKTKITLLNDQYDAIALTGTLTEVKQNNGKTTYNIKVLDPKYNGADYKGATTSGGQTYVTYTDVAKDYSDLLYQNVRVLVKPDSNGKDAVVYGVYATNKNTTQTGILKDIKMDGTSKVKLNGTKYDLADDTTVYVNGKVLTEKDSNNKDTKVSIATFLGKYGDAGTQKYQDSKYYQPTEISLIAVDGTSNYSILKVKTFAVAKVTSVGSDYVNLSWKAGAKDIIKTAKCEDDSWTWYKDIAKNDYVVVTSGDNYASGNGLIEKATVVSGKVNGTRGDADVSIGDNWYTMAGKAPAAVNRPNTNSNVEMVVVNGYVYYTDTTVGSVDDMALLVEAAPSGGVNSKWEARMIFADGTDKVVTIEKKWDDKDDGKAIAEFHEGASANPNATSGTISAGGANVYAAPMLVSYEVSKDVYTLTRIGYPNTDNASMTSRETNGYDEFVWGNTLHTDSSIKAKDNGSMQYGNNSGTPLSKLYYEATGIVFVKYSDKQTSHTAGSTTYIESDASYKVITGKAASNYDRDLGSMTAVANKSGNSYYAQAAFIDLGEKSTGGNSDNYAVVLKNVEKKTGTADGTVYLITAWNGKETITVKTDASAAASMVKGSVFSYTATGDTLADIEYKVETKTSGTVTATYQKDFFVKSYDAASGDITLQTSSEASGVYTMADYQAGVKAWNNIDSKDTTVLFVDSDNGVGVASGDIELSYVCDGDYWSQGVVPSTFKKDAQGNLYEIDASGNAVLYKNGQVTQDSDGAKNTFSQDFEPSVHVYVDNSTDDQITVIVVDVNRNINQW